MATKQPTAAALRAAITELNASGAEAGLDKLIAARRAMLLSAPDDQIIEVDLTIARQRIAIERAAARRDDLTVQLAEAEEAEAEAAFRTRHSDVVAARDSVLKSYSGEYAKAARTIATVAEAERASESAIRSLSEGALERYGLARPAPASTIAWSQHFLNGGVSLADVALPPTKSSPALGALAEAPLALNPVLGA
jgi:hypothetical protein